MALAAHQSGSGPRVVLVHGFAQNRHCWGRLDGDLASAGYQVVTVDAPGHGDAAEVRAGLWDTADLLARLGPAAYLGYSMGGRMALHVALRHPAMVRGLILVSATAGIDDDAERLERRRADEALAEALEASARTLGERAALESFIDRWLAGPLFAGLPESLGFRQQRLHNTTAGLASSLRLAGAHAQDPLWDRLGELAMPTLIVTGDGDEKFTRLGDRIQERIGAPTRRLRVPHAGHSCHLEQPRLVLEAVCRFLDGLDRPGPHDA